MFLPREGTEIHVTFPLLFSVSDITHTPQGDGNCVMLPKSRMYFKRNNPHPARGRKPLALPDNLVPPLKQSTPRKGTKNRTSGYCRPNRRKTLPTPLGDGNSATTTCATDST